MSKQHYLVRAAPLLAALSLAACHPAPIDPASAGPLLAGAAQRPLDEPVGLPTAGYTQDAFLSGPLPADDPGSPYADIFPATRGVETQPMAKALALANGRSTLVLARIDAVFVTELLTERVLAKVLTDIKIDLHGKLILDATHTHAAGCRFSRDSMDPQVLATQPPGAQQALAHGCDTFDQEMLERISASIAGTIEDAMAAMRPARLGTASMDDATSAHDRRCENDWITGGPDQDTRVTVLRVEGQDGLPIAALFHYAMHGTISGSTNRNLSIDAPGHAELAVERQFKQPVVAMYLQGNAGDASPNSGGNAGTQGMEWAGRDIASTVGQLWTQSSSSLESSVVLQSLEREVTISHDILGYAAGEFYPDGAVLCQYLYSPPCPGAALPSSQVVCPGPSLPGKGKTRSRVMAARVGNLALVTLPGEPVAAVGRALRTQVLAEGKGLTDALVLGYAQDHDGYLLFDSDWLSGGYEPTISFWGWKYATFIVQQSGDVLHELVSGSALHKALPEPAPVDSTPAPYAAAIISDTTGTPGVTTQPPAQLTRLAPMDVVFLTGDPALGNPEVRLQSSDASGTFTDVLQNGWIPVSSQRGEITLTWSASPTYTASPGASSRVHSWTAHYEPPIDLPAGTYRLHLTGQAQEDLLTLPIDLATQPFSVVPDAQLAFDSALSVANGQLSIALTARYAERVAVFAPAPSPEWQLDGFRLVDARYTAPFAPADPGTTPLAASLLGASATQALQLLPANLTYPPGPAPYAPGAGPGFAATASVASGHYTLALNAGAYTDVYGNGSAAVSFEVDVP